MYGFELTKARQELRRELRRAAVGELPPGTALDGQELLLLAGDLAAGNRVRLIQRKLIVEALTTRGYGVELIAAAWALPEDVIRQDLTRRVIDSEAVAAAIEARVLDELPETPEPGRVAAATGARAVPGTT